VAIWNPLRRPKHVTLSADDVLPAPPLPVPLEYRPAPVATLARRSLPADIGAIGTTYYSGFLQGEEHKPELQGLAGLARYAKMWRNDGDVGALRRAVTQPLLSAKWSIKPASDDPLDKEIAQFVQDNLMGGMDVTWREHLSQALLFYRDGHQVFHKQFVLGDDGKVRLLKLAPRLSRTLYQWWVNPDGTLDHITQRVYVPGKKGGPGVYEPVDLPGNELLVYTLEKEGANFQGVSLMRNAEPHWAAKQDLYRIDLIACERNALGIPEMKEPQSPDPVQRDSAAETLARLHAHEQAYVLTPYGYEFHIRGVEGATHDVIPSIQHHSLEIVKSALATFLNLDQTGSYARDWSQSSLFLQNLFYVASIICETQGRDVIRPLVDYNWTVDRYPTMQCEDLDKRDIAEFIKGLGPLYIAGAITNNTDTENALRRKIDYPDLPNPEDLPGETIDTDSQGQAAAGKAPGSDEAPPEQPEGSTTGHLARLSAEELLARGLTAEEIAELGLGDVIAGAVRRIRAGVGRITGRTVPSAYRWVWELGDGGASGSHCPACLDLADGSPYEPDALPTRPRAGGTFCGDACTCEVRKVYADE
jgi:hypothetical protein